MIQLKQKIAESIAEMVKTETLYAIFQFIDGSSTSFIEATKTISHDTVNKIYNIHLAFVLVLSEAKTVEKISFYDYNYNLLYEDVNLSISLPSGETYFEEKLKIQYT